MQRNTSRWNAWSPSTSTCTPRFAIWDHPEASENCSKWLAKSARWHERAALNLRKRISGGSLYVGFFHDDTRFLSHLELRVGGQQAVSSNTTHFLTIFEAVRFAH